MRAIVGCAFFIRESGKNSNKTSVAQSDDNFLKSIERQEEFILKKAQQIFIIGFMSGVFALVALGMVTKSTMVWLLLLDGIAAVFSFKNKLYRQTDEMLKTRTMVAIVAMVIAFVTMVNVAKTPYVTTQSANGTQVEIASLGGMLLNNHQSTVLVFNEKDLKVTPTHASPDMVIQKYDAKINDVAIVNMKIKWRCIASIGLMFLQIFLVLSFATAPYVAKVPKVVANRIVLYR